MRIQGYKVEDTRMSGVGHKDKRWRIQGYKMEKTRISGGGYKYIR